MDKYAYFVLMLKFFVPLYVIGVAFFWRYFVRNRKMFLFVCILTSAAYFIGDTIAVSIGAWSYSPDKTLLPLILDGSALDTLIWFNLLGVIFFLVISIWIDRLEKNLPLFIPSFFLKRIKSNNIKNFLIKYL